MASIAALAGADSLHLPDSVALALTTAHRFAIDRAAALAQFESFGNENWLIERDDGSRVVLRRYLHTREERVRFQLGLQHRLRDAGFPASPVLPSTTGASFETDEHGIPWAAFAHVEGREYNFSLEDAVQAARSLASFHLFGRQYTDPAPALAHRPSIRDCWLNAEADVEGLRALFEGVDVADDLDYLEAWWRFVLREWPLDRIDALPSGLVHGDFHGRNTAYDIDGVLRAVFDFDDVEPGPLAHDLAGAAFKFARTSRFDTVPRPHVVHAFIDAYDAVRPLTPEERAALPVLMATSYPPNPRYYAYYRDHHASNLANRLRREVGIMRMLRSQLATLFGTSFS